MSLMKEKLDQYWRDYLGSERFWQELRADLAGGRHPHPRAIGKVLRNGKPVPDWAADYIEGRLAGTIKLPRGLPDWSPVGLSGGEVSSLCPRAEYARFERQHRRNLLAFLVRRWERGYSHPRYKRWREYLHRRQHGQRSNPPHISPYAAAKEKASRIFGVPVDTLDKMVYPRRNGRQ